MIVRRLDLRASSKGVLDYNEFKCDRGVAEVVAINNIIHDDWFTRQRTILEREELPSIAANTRKKSFHLNVDPGVKDEITADECLVLIHDIMKFYGYENQPYIVYRHFDIEREHYHIVSTRVDEDGKIIPEINTRKLIHFLRDNEQKYHYITGNGNLKKERSFLDDVKTYNPKYGSSADVFYTLFVRALNFDCRSLGQLFMVLDTMGIKGKTSTRHDGGKNIILQGITQSHKIASRPVSMESKANYRAYDSFYERAVAARQGLGSVEDTGRRTSVDALSEWAMNNSHDFADYADLMSQLGVKAYASFDKKSWTIKRLVLIDYNTRHVSDSLDRTLDIESYNELFKKGLWPKTDKRTRKTPRLTKEQKNTLFAFAKSKSDAAMLEQMREGKEKGRKESTVKSKGK